MRLLLFALALCLPAGAAEPQGDAPSAVAGEPGSGGADERIAHLEARLARARAAERPRLQLELGELHRLAGHPDEAREAFRGALASTRDPAVTTSAELGLALLAAGPTRDDTDPREAARLAMPPSDTPLATQEAARHVTLARWAVAAGEDPRPVVRAALAATSPEDRPQLREALAEVGALQRVAQTSPLERARAALARGDRGAARSLASGSLQDGLDADARRAAERILRAADGAALAPGRVGVLLPLSGRFEAVGRQVEEALRHGWAVGGRTEGLVVRDTGGTPEGALAAFLDLVQTEGVVAVLGPLLSDETAGVVTAADDLGVPLVVLSQALDRPETHPWTLLAWPTVRAQVERLVGFAMERRGWTRFVVLAPDTSYGAEAAEQFAAAVTARGGTLRAREAYPVDAKDYRALAVRIAGPHDAEKPPVVDYDAIFVPDRARRVTLVAAALAFEEIPVGAFDPHETGTVPLLGLSGWTGTELVAGGAKNLEGGIFTEVFVPPEAPLTWHLQTVWGPFVDAYRAAFSRTPTSVEALAVDAGHLVARATQARPPHREAALDALLTVQIEGTVTGITGISTSLHAADHQIRLLSVAKDGFVPIEE